jgi:lysosomal alpha-mannosidase
MLNVSQCQSTELNTSFVVTLYNPLARQSSHIVRLPVKDRPYIVKDHQGRLVTSQLIPLPESVLRLPGRTSEATHDLVFHAVDLPPLGLRSYHIHNEPGLKIRKRKIVVQLPAPRDFVVSSKDSSLTFDRRTGLLKQVGGHLVSQELLYYRGMKGNNTRFEYRASGAYIFRPDGPAVPVGSVSRLVSFVDPDGAIEVHQYVATWATVIFRLAKDQPDFVELDWIIGPIPIDDGIGKEVVSRFTSLHITDSEGLFYTDSNGREVLERRIDFQPTYQFNVTEPIAGNYYPVNSVAFIRDKSTSAAMAVLTDRAQGASSSSSGSLEFMVFSLFISLNPMMSFSKSNYFYLRFTAVCFMMMRLVLEKH